MADDPTGFIPVVKEVGKGGSKDFPHNVYLRRDKPGGRQLIVEARGGEMHQNATIVRHPLLQQSLTILRNVESDTAAFRHHATIVASFLLIEATRHLHVAPINITTPLAETTGEHIDDQLVIVPVLRAGLALLPAAQTLLPDVPVGFLGLERDEHTAVAREYYQKFPNGLSDYKAIILDPMLATGGSLEETIHAVTKRGCNQIVLVCVVAAPEGIERVMTTYPDTQLYTAAIDSHLDERKFIVPGLGDFGDRYFGT